MVRTTLPLNSLGFFIVGMGSDAAPQPGGSQGVLCHGGAGVGRYSKLAAQSTASGEPTLPISPSSLSSPSGPVAALPGQTWNSQAWHRDSVSGAAASNFTNAVRVRFL